MPIPTSSPSDVATWFNDHFIRSFINEVSPDKWQGDTGFFSIVLLSLAHCNAAAGLVNGTGDATSREAINFIESWLGRPAAPSESRYQKRAVGLYTLFRHGLAHQREPGQIRIGTNQALTWWLDRSRNRDNHLRLYGPRQKLDDKTIPADLFCLRVSCDLLFADALEAFRALHARLAADAGLAAEVYAGLTAVERPRVLRGTNIDQDFAAMVKDVDPQ